MERMVKILKYLKNYQTNSISNMTTDIGITEEEIQKLCDLGILYGERTGYFQISSRKLTNQMIELLLSSRKEITKQELTAFGISDYHIRRLLADGRLTMVKKGIYQSNIVKIQMEEPRKSQNLTVTHEMLCAIEENNLPEVIRILEATQKDEFIELSKGLWKWVMTQILGNGPLDKDESKKQEIKEEIIPEVTPTLEEERKESDSEIIDKVREVPEKVAKETIYEEVPLSTITSTESDMKEQETETDSMEYTPTGLPFRELYSLYLANRYKDPILAKEFLLEYKDQCEIHNIKFNYLDLKRINQLIEDFNIPKEQLEKEQELKLRIKDLMNRNLTDEELNDLDRTLNQFYDLYQERGIISNLYRGDYQAKVKNHSEALRIYNSLLQKEPWNTTIYHRKASVFLKTKKVEQLIRVLETSLSYVPNDDFWRAQLVFCYMDKNKFSKVRELVELENFNKLSQYEWCLRTIILRLKNILYQYKLNASGNISYTSLKRHNEKIERVDLELEYYQELYSQLADYHDFEEVMMTGESLLSPYEDEVYWATSNQENGNISPRELEEYVKNLQISQDEELLLYIAAAKVMFTHKLPKHGEHYLKLVSKAHSKNPTVKQEYQQCIRNKTLYLNK